LEFWINASDESGQRLVGVPESLFTEQQELSISAQNISTLFKTWLLFASGFLFGLFLFKKNAILKSFLFWTVVVVALGSFAGLIFLLTTGSFSMFVGFGTVRIGSNESICLNTMYPILSFVIHVFISLSLIAISRVKFNEKTI
jgi:glucan phosphoethanolaminetransferase (alkaline phosphatase superfamily)